jgi:hypothetical protein
MRHLRATLGLAVAVCAFALAATPALAAEFLASKEGATHGKNETEQIFHWGQSFEMICFKTRSKGHMAAGFANSYATEIKFAKCVVKAKIGLHTFYIHAKWLTPLAIEYYPNGFVEIGSELEEEGGRTVLSGGTAELKFKTGVNIEEAPEEFEPSVCEVRIPSQTIPARAEKHPENEYEAATFTNEVIPHKISNRFPTGEQHIIKISNHLTRIFFEFEGEPCEEWGHEEEEEDHGNYTGSFPQKLSGGNLYFE